MLSSYMPKSKSDIHETPDRVFELIYEQWNHKKEEMYDPCPADTPYKAAIFFNGLYGDWKDFNYVNPPYTLLKEFVTKALQQIDKGKLTILLLPSKTDQEWFHNLQWWHSEILWIRKRLKFKGSKWSATQPHFLVLLD